MGTAKKKTKTKTINDNALKKDVVVRRRQKIISMTLSCQNKNREFNLGKKYLFTHTLFIYLLTSNTKQPKKKHSTRQDNTKKKKEKRKIEIIHFYFLVIIFYICNFCNAPLYTILAPLYTILYGTSRKSYHLIFLESSSGLEILLDSTVA